MFKNLICVNTVKKKDKKYHPRLNYTLGCHNNFALNLKDHITKKFEKYGVPVQIVIKIWKSNCMSPVIGFHS